MKRPPRRTGLCLVAIVGAVAASLPAGRAAGEIKIMSRDGWKLTTDGRINNFLSVARGNWLPNMEPPYTGVDDEPTADNRIASSRLRTGFVETVMAFELNKQMTEGTSFKARLAFWVLTGALRTALDSPAAEAREAYFKLEGGWGELLVGRSMGLFARGGILLDYEVEHGYGLGFPCATKEVQGGACGHAGFGLLFPGFHSGIVYGTPKVGGLQLSAGIYDPIQFAASNYRRTPYPRPEAELTFATPNRLFTAFVGGVWQRISTTLMAKDPVTMMPTKVDYDFAAEGVNYGLGLNFGWLMLGMSGFFGQGLGLTVPLEDNPAIILAGRPGLRSEDGYWGAAALVFGGTKLAAGVGITRAKPDSADPDPKVTPNIPYVARQLGASAGVYQTVAKMVTFAVEYFGAQFTWFDRMTVDANGDAFVERPRQLVHFVNVGATVVW